MADKIEDESVVWTDSEEDAATLATEEALKGRVISKTSVIFYCHHCGKLLTATKTYYFKEIDGRARYVLETTCDICGKLIKRKEF